MTAGAWKWAGVAIFAIAIGLAPFWMKFVGSPFWIDIISEILIWSLLAASVNLLLGYVGLLSFGQALYFGFGMYGVAIGISHFGLGLWPSLLLGIAASGLMAAFAGAFAVRLSWHYFAIITVVFSLIFYFAAMSAKGITGGDDGLSFSTPVLWKAAGLTLSNKTTQFYFIYTICFACYAAVALLVASPLGMRFRAVRDNEKRAALIGINVYLTRWIAFVIAGLLAGVGGALFALFGRYASASYMFYHVSGEAVVWAIVGGLGTLMGPLVGTALLIMFREIVSGYWENYLIAVGVLVILVIMLAPRGIVGSLDEFLNWTKPDPDAPEDAIEALAEMEKSQ
ncbi:MAG: branched-chain amino acid ABC transporter permease [Bradyrhizobiaceae bacterium]|nr:MAG: branched-chain amino acid ABC transporter permease [Bradyrhizobiaceae bacterium]